MNDANPHVIAFSNPRPVVRTRLKGRDVYFAVIDTDIAQRLGVDEESCTFEQAITEQGVIFRLKRKAVTLEQRENFSANGIVGPYFITIMAKL